ncbi:succinate dehydrogenase cytochrome b558 subunit [Ammoniphilus resinae]|uniref:Succinate dehydrogenase / fumarate reductase cytochrome b subunit n=1 Tax=Ammoniphilus resinae TaxID=861532 RepID=A0ABS4GJD9_9BACL|nr:succinate dehydrogenase cytochrome b558 subunit [Ammoniphilus resinae]MBP1930361.1 succinate dehydrogenase / fumarate reductase cytochrome b subunit [Ammoniphilus resinae]
MATDRHFFNRKLHSLLGVIPVGAFLLVHLYTNYLATLGRERFTEQVEFMETIPFLIIVEILFIFLPLLYHAVYGLYIAFQAKHNVNNYGYFRNMMFFLQRVTGVITLIFVVWHVWQTRIQIAIGSVAPEGFFDLMVNVFSSGAMVAFYVIGLLSATFHFSNGMWSFLVSWGITVGPRAQRISTYVWLGFFVILSYIGLMAMFAFINPV